MAETQIQAESLTHKDATLCNISTSEFDVQNLDS